MIKLCLNKTWKNNHNSSDNYLWNVYSVIVIKNEEIERELGPIVSRGTNGQ